MDILKSMERREFLLAGSAFAAALAVPQFEIGRILGSKEAPSLRLGLRPKQASWFDLQKQGSGPLPREFLVELTKVELDLTPYLLRGEIDLGIVPGDELASVKAGPLFEALYGESAQDWRGDLDESWSPKFLRSWQASLERNGMTIVPRVIAVTNREVGFFARPGATRGSLLGSGAHPAHRLELETLGLSSFAPVATIGDGLAQFANREADALPVLPHDLNLRLFRLLANESLVYHRLTHFPAPRLVGFYSAAFWNRLTERERDRLDFAVRKRAELIALSSESRSREALNALAKAFQFDQSGPIARRT
jgi:hypothetical protein